MHTVILSSLAAQYLFLGFLKGFLKLLRLGNFSQRLFLYAKNVHKLFTKQILCSKFNDDDGYNCNNSLIKQQCIYTYRLIIT